MYRLGWMVAFVGCALFIACYKPSFRDCAISCDSPAACPSGLTCDMSAHMCTTGTSCSGVVDAPMNGDGSGSGSCFAFTPSNFDPCAIPHPSGALDVGSGSNVEIDAGSCTPYTFMSQQVCLFHYTSVTIGGAVAINGAMPVILVSDSDITVTGSITTRPSNMNQAGCNTPVAANGGDQGAGGGGGGYGGSGGAGGTGTSTAATPGAGPFGLQALVPLVLGCPGGRGASTSASAIGGAGGYGGGALELSAQGQLQVSGVVTANGEGGGGGQVILGSPTTGAGGGGGGTGGSLLLEADKVTITSSAQVCAIGGGGGQGGDIGPINNGTAGDTSINCTLAHGGGSAGTAGTGGTGGALAAATDGQPHDSGHGGGGGGGAEGRVRIHSIMAPSISGLAPIAPSPYVQ